MAQHQQPYYSIFQFIKMATIPIQNKDVFVDNQTKTANRIAITEIQIKYTLIGDKSGGVDAENNPIVASDDIKTDLLPVPIDSLREALVTEISGFVIGALGLLPPTA